MRITIGTLIEAIAEFKQHSLEDNRELYIEDLRIQVSTPTGKTTIKHVIKKENLPGRKVELEDGHVVVCADRHIFQQDSKDVFADILENGDVIDTKTGTVKIKSIINVTNQDFYDIAIEAPHIYYDAYGIAHHNTITSAALSLAVEVYGRSLVIVPNKSLILQTEQDYKLLGLDVGVYYGERKELGKTHTICTWQSLSALERKAKKTKKKTEDEPFPLEEFLDDLVCFIVDEAHSGKAKVLQELLCGPFAQVPLRFGMTGTIPKENIDFYAILAAIGPVVNRLSAKELQDQGVLATCKVNILRLRDYVEYPDYASENTYLTTDKERMKWIANKIKNISLTGNTLVLVNRIKSAEILCENIQDAHLVYGNTKNEDRKSTYDDASSSDGLIIVATYGVAAVGINIPRIFNLVIIEPGKSFVRIIQSIGRGIRKAKDKDHVEIWDVCSTAKFSSKHINARKKLYDDQHYEYSESKLDWS